MNDAAKHDRRHQQANLRLAWILASVALVLGAGFVVKIWLLSH